MNKFVLLAWGAMASLALTSCGGSSSPASTPSVPASSEMTINPSLVTVPPGNSLVFNADVNGSSNTLVNWTVQEGAAGGSIDSAGNYTAPINAGTFHITATSQANPSLTATSTVTVAGEFVVSVTPSSEVLGPVGIRTFTASVPVTWSVQEGAIGGAITAGGVYTAPGATGEFHVVATAVQVPGKNSVAQVTVVSSGFKATGAMGTARTAHTVTLLQDGRVLVTGGASCYLSSGAHGCPLHSSEIYDPSTGTFSTTGSMLGARFSHTATLLSNGQVLLAGGDMSATAELYDPASKQFFVTGSMGVDRAHHTATLLHNGKVLIAGGVTLSGELATAELYDPNTGTFTATGTMTGARDLHTATLLANGKVLIAGGSNGTDSLSTAELYDPATGKFTPTGSMAGKRAFHSAALLGTSNVLVAGGFVPDGWGEWLSSAEVYDVATGTFTVTGSMMTERSAFFAIPLADGKVLVSGGGSEFTAELYDPQSGLFTQTGSTATLRSEPAAVLLQDGRVLVSGGSDSNSAELYQ